MTKRNTTTAATAAAEKFEAIKDDGVSPADIGEALAVLAAAFYSEGMPQERFDPATGEVYHLQEVNDTEFQMQSMLKNVVSNAQWMADNAAQRRDKMVRDAQELQRNSRGSDWEIAKANRLADWLTRCVTAQVPMTEEFATITKACYERLTGQEYAPFVKNGNATSKSEVASTALDEALKAASGK